jgi:hypothetical protein
MTALAAVDLPIRHRTGNAAVRWIIAAASLGSHLGSTHTEY